MGPYMTSSPQVAPWRFIVAFDFGTYASGIAFKQLRSFGSTSSAAWQFSDWPDQPTPYAKTRSAILYDGRRPIAWGWRALKAYSSLAATGCDLQKYTYLQDFKLALDEGSGYRMPAGFDAVTVIADYLRFMKEYTLQKLQNAFPMGNVHADLVQWCLTVPAMWTDEQKDAMRSAAHRAGLVSEKDSEQLLVILEPEAAALHARVSRDVEMEEDSVFMVVDAGGGTVDITMHKVVSRNGETVLSELAPGLGGCCGSTYVDKNFEQWFRAQVGKAVFDSWKERCPAEYLELMGQWETAKRGFRGSRQAAARVKSPIRALMHRMDQHFIAKPKSPAVSISIPAKLLEGLDANAAAKLEEQNDGYDDRLLITQSQMKAFFDPVIDEVVQLVAAQNVLAGQCKGGKVLLVGGFSGSPYFTAQVKQQISTDASDVLCPPHPATAVLLGTPWMHPLLPFRCPAGHSHHVPLNISSNCHLHSLLRHLCVGCIHHLAVAVLVIGMPSMQ
jgi:hypothetical protein